MKKGLAFEKEVEKLFRSLGKKHVVHNVHLRYGSLHSQFDVCFGYHKKKYIECKYRSKKPVYLQDVASFAAKLQLHAIPYSRGIMVTNQSYVKRAESYANRLGIRLIDGIKLSRLKRSPLRLWYVLF